MNNQICKMLSISLKFTPWTCKSTKIKKQTTNVIHHKTGVTLHEHKTTMELMTVSQQIIHLDFLKYLYQTTSACIRSDLLIRIWQIYILDLFFLLFCVWSLENPGAFQKCDPSINNISFSSTRSNGPRKLILLQSDKY